MKDFITVVRKGNPDFIWRVAGTTSGSSPCAVNVHEHWNRLPWLYDWVLYNNGLVITSPINLN